MTVALSGCRWVISGRNAHQFFSSRPWGSLLPRGPRRGNPAAEDCHRRSKTRSRLLVTSGVPSPFHSTQNCHPDLRISLGGRVAAIASIVPERALLWRRRLSDAVDERRDERGVALAERVHWDRLLNRRCIWLSVARRVLNSRADGAALLVATGAHVTSSTSAATWASACAPGGWVMTGWPI